MREVYMVLNSNMVVEKGLSHEEAYELASNLQVTAHYEGSTYLSPAKVEIVNYWEEEDED